MEQKEQLREYKLHMKYVGSDESEGHVEAHLIDGSGEPYDHHWEADSYSEVIEHVFYELGHRLISYRNKLTITFDT